MDPRAASAFALLFRPKTSGRRELRSEGEEVKSPGRGSRGKRARELISSQPASQPVGKAGRQASRSSGAQLNEGANVGPLNGGEQLNGSRQQQAKANTRLLRCSSIESTWPQSSALEAKSLALALAALQPPPQAPPPAPSRVE